MSEADDTDELCDIDEASEGMVWQILEISRPVRTRRRSGAPD